jgi:hypothetical protein
MKISRIRAFKAALPYRNGAHGLDAGEETRLAKASVIVIDADAGLSDCGEFKRAGENDMATQSEDEEDAARLPAPRVLDENPRRTTWIDQIKEKIIRGEGHAKEPSGRARRGTLATALESTFANCGAAA